MIACVLVLSVHTGSRMLAVPLTKSWDKMINYKLFWMNKFCGHSVMIANVANDVL